MSSIKKNNSTKQLEEEIDALSRNLYLESPDLWIDFSDKMGDHIFDEMVLFFACKYSSPYIVKHAVGNKLIDLESPSRNANFKTIRQHLSATAKQYNSKDLYNFLDNSSDTSLPVDDKHSNDEPAKEEKVSTYYPKFNCDNCNHNIFEYGYKVCENTTYKFSSEHSKPIQVPNGSGTSIVCLNCNNEIDNMTEEKLNLLCKIENCSNCGRNLIEAGLVNKTKMSFDSDQKKFISNELSSHCSNCDFEINKLQKDYFSL